MRWPWRNRNDDEDVAELERAERHLARVRRQWPAVHEAAAEIRAHKERNHFAEKIRTIYQGGES